MPRKIMRAAIDQGITPNAPAIAARSRLSERTVERMLAGAPVSSHTIAAITRAFAGGVEDFFEVDDDTVPASPPLLRAVRL
jgi:hypothetical protein